MNDEVMTANRYFFLQIKLITTGFLMGPIGYKVLIQRFGILLYLTIKVTCIASRLAALCFMLGTTALIEIKYRK